MNICRLFGVCALLFFCTPLFSQPLDVGLPATAMNGALDSIIPRIVFLRRVDHRCGTGVIVSPHRILTADHMLGTACESGVCSGIEVSRAVGLHELPTERITGEPLRVAMRGIGEDWVILESTSELSQGPPIARATHLTEEILTFGFPSCKTLQLVRGRLTLVTPAYLETSLALSFGSSGSPLLTPAGELLGVVTGSPSPWDAVRVRLLGGTFKATGIPATPFLFSSELSPSPERCRGAVSTLAEDYQQRVVKLTGVERLVASLFFTRSVDQFIVCAQQFPELSSMLLSRSLYLPEAVATWPSADGALRTLITGSILEQRGALANESTALTLENLPEDLRPVLREYLASGYRGIERTMYSYALWGCGAALILGVLWAFTALALYARLPGSRWARVLCSGALAIMVWPFVIVPILYLWKKRV